MTTAYYLQSNEQVECYSKLPVSRLEGAWLWTNRIGTNLSNRKLILKLFSPIAQPMFPHFLCSVIRQHLGPVTIEKPTVLST